jgi:3-hydroxyacyl-[acyl-carrier-protein] dehydratase
MLRDSFYTILSQDQQNESSVITNVKINAAHDIFNGHFPGNPVVPGVCMLQMIKDILSEKVGRDIRLQSLSNVKFIAVVDPTQHDTLEINIKFENNGENAYKVNAVITAQDIVFLKISNAVYIKL